MTRRNEPDPTVESVPKRGTDVDDQAKLDQMDALGQNEAAIADLKELRRELRSALISKATAPTALAGLSKELRAVNAELNALLNEGEKEETSAERIKRERAERRARAADRPPTARRGKSGRGARSD